MDENTMGNQFEEPDQPMQSLDTIMQIIAEATIPAVGSHGLMCMTDDLEMDYDDDMDDLDDESELDIESSGEIVYALWQLISKCRNEELWDLSLGTGSDFERIC